MAEMHVRQPGFTYSACESFTKSKERGELRYIYHKELDKASFQNDMAYGAYKYLPRRTASSKALPDNEFARASNPQYD